MTSELIFSLHTDQHIKDAVNIFGYAYGYNRITKHFNEFVYRNLKLRAVQNSPEAPIQMFYMEPEWYNQKTMTNLRSPDFKKFYDHQYKIYGTHLEATKVWPHWIDSMNAVDEIWVGNQFAKDSVLNSGVTTPTFVFEHGIDDMWKPKRRGQGNKIRFLHVDSDSPRKRADLVEKAFLELFKNNPNVEITFKHHGVERGPVFSVNDLIEEKTEDNINRIYQTLSQESMVDLFYSHDILIYPSEGEGFGFIPLQALATGMPTISTGRWCSYENYLGGNVIESKLGKTEHTGYHYGEVVLAEYDSLLHLMKNAVDNFEQQCDYFYAQANDVYNKYNWQNRCNQMLTDLIKRVGIKMLKPLPDFKPIPPSYLFYEGNGSYSLSDGIRFDRDNRITSVKQEIASSLLTTGLFRKATIEEIKKIDPYYSYS
jgi:glycosyltransferase involved in cell wall biosynthesis